VERKEQSLPLHFVCGKMQLMQVCFYWILSVAHNSWSFKDVGRSGIVWHMCVQWHPCWTS